MELKIDGVAASLIYEDGQLARAITRGNGQQGDDITHNIRAIPDVPLRLLGDEVPAVLEVRGEVYMANSELVRINEAQSAKGLPPFANTRNAILIPSSYISFNKSTINYSKITRTN